MCHSARLWALIAVALVASTGVSACGGDDGPATVAESAGVLPDPERVIDDPPVTATTAKAQIQETVDDLQDGLLTLSGWGICNEIVAAAERAVAHDGRTCTEYYDRILRSPAMAKRRRVRSEVVSVDVAPARRAATARVVSPGGRAFDIRLRQEDGGWKLAGIDLQDPSGLRAD